MTLSRSLAGLAVVATFCATLGAGCFSSQVPTSSTGGGTGITTGASSSTSLGILSGDQVVLEEPATVTTGTFMMGPLTRTVTVTSFRMGDDSAASWELKNTKGTTLRSGSWAEGGLNTAHPFFLPAVFESRTRPVDDAALLWLAREEYRELKATSGTTIDPGFLNVPDWAVRMNARPAANRAFLALGQLAREAEQARQDLTYARVEGASTEKSLRINGKEVQVPVVTLRNWYGTYEVLDNPENPLVLSFTLNPKTEKSRLDISKGDGLELANLTNYRVKELILTGR